ncbi:hypothetical protein BKA66DRAFT_322925 [Pyrenochaeta sp. MPI-SDFR-AT-0127]|nr:hypothetical protein BKA66DRAFT_322925 [Pyrenochaeta sp. MPI-SDFR-AT-0127]
MSTSPSGSRQQITTAPFRLLDLPPELRNEIYARIVYKFERKSRRERHAKHVRGIFAQLPLSIRNFLLTCKTIWGELLSILFGSYVWVADLRFRNIYPGLMDIISKESWLVNPSTFTRPTSGSIRSARFNLEQRHIKEATSDRDRYISFFVEICLTRTPPNYRVVVWVFVRAAGLARVILGDESMGLRTRLEGGIGERLEQLVASKKLASQCVTNLTIEEWDEIVMTLKSVYLAWVREEILSSSDQ